VEPPKIKLKKVCWEIRTSFARFHVSTGIKFQIVVCWILTPCNDLVGYPSPWRWKRHSPPKHWCPITSLHGFTTQKTISWSTNFAQHPRLSSYSLSVLAFYVKTEINPASETLWTESIPQSVDIIIMSVRCHKLFALHTANGVIVPVL